jgi:Zn-dependent protease
MQFSRRELRDLLAAWVVLSLAFGLFFAGGVPGLRADGLRIGLIAISFFTAGVGFLAHELAHKVVAVRFGQIAAFRADYSMLALAMFSAAAGWLFAAPGAVHHRGRLTDRERGLIALAGPLMNVALAVVFFGIMLVPESGRLGTDGVLVNAVLAAFNMIPFGPLDGRTVAGWSKVVFAIVFLCCLALAYFAIAVVGVAP